MNKSCVIPIPSFVNLPHEPFLTLECFYSNLQPFAHVLWVKLALELLVFGSNWGQIGRKCCSWLKMPRIIPIPCFIILACKPNLTLECFCSCLQSCAHVIWAIVALKLSIFGQIWDRLGSKWCVWIKTIYDSHPRLCKPCLWTNFNFGVLRSILEPCTHVIWAKSAPELLVFGQNWVRLGVSLAENVVVGLKCNVWFLFQAL